MARRRYESCHHTTHAINATLFDITLPHFYLERLDFRCVLFVLTDFGVCLQMRAQQLSSKTQEYNLNAPLSFSGLPVLTDLGLCPLVELGYAPHAGIIGW